MFHIIRKSLFFIFILAMLPVYADVYVDTVNYYAIDFNDASVTVKDYIQESLIVNCSIEITTFDNPCIVNAVITENYENKVIYIKSQEVLPNSKAVMNVNSFVLTPSFNYNVKVIVNEEEYTYTYINTYDLPQITVFTPSNAYIDMNEMPVRLQDYYQFNQINLNSSEWEYLSEEQENAIIKWVKLGGALNIDPSSIKSQREGKDSKNSVLNRNYFYNTYFSSPLNEYIGINSRLNHSDVPDTIFESYLYPDWELNELNTMLFIPLIIVIALILGPGIVIYSKKKNKPVLMLVFIPAFSIVFTLVLFITSILQYGLIPKVSETSVAYIDQITGEVLINQLTGIESPIGGPALEFPEDAYVNPVNNIDAFCNVSNGSMIFSAKSVPAKIPVFFHMKRIYTDRRKLEITENLKDITVLNALGTDVMNIYITIDEGLIYYDKVIKAGETVTIDKDEYLQREYIVYSDIRITDFTPFDMLNQNKILKTGMYEAVLRDNIFGVSIYNGNRIEVGLGNNTLIGVYEDYR